MAPKAARAPISFAGLRRARNPATVITQRLGPLEPAQQRVHLVSLIREADTSLTDRQSELDIDCLVAKTILDYAADAGLADDLNGDWRCCDAITQIQDCIFAWQDRKRKFQREVDAKVRRIRACPGWAEYPDCIPVELRTRGAKDSLGKDKIALLTSLAERLSLDRALPLLEEKAKRPDGTLRCIALKDVEAILEELDGSGLMERTVSYAGMAPSSAKSG